jgi:hypothetical protein
MAIGRDEKNAITAVARYLRLNVVASPFIYASMYSEEVLIVIAIIKVTRISVDVRSPKALDSVKTGNCGMVAFPPVVVMLTCCATKGSRFSKTIFD